MARFGSHMDSSLAGEALKESEATGLRKWRWAGGGSLPSKYWPMGTGDSQDPEIRLVRSLLFCKRHVALQVRRTADHLEARITKQSR